jgi:hypothetical protein
MRVAQGGCQSQASNSSVIPRTPRSAVGGQEESGRPDSHLFGGAVPPAGPWTSRGVVVSESLFGRHLLCLPVFRLGGSEGLRYW